MPEPAEQLAAAAGTFAKTAPGPAESRIMALELPGKGTEAFSRIWCETSRLGFA